MTVIDNRVIGILAKRAPNVTVVQAQNICTELAEQGILPLLTYVGPPVDKTIKRQKTIDDCVKSYFPVDDYDNDPSPEEVEKLCVEARREGTRTDDVARSLGRPPAVEGFTHEEAMEEIKRLRKYEDYVIESGYILGFKQWVRTK